MTGIGPVERGPLRRRRPAHPHPHPRPRRHPMGQLPQLSTPLGALGRASITPAPHPQALRVAAAVAGAYAYTALTTTPARPAPTLRPSQATFLHYEGSGLPVPQHPHTATFRFTISVRDLHPVTTRQVRSGLPGLSAHVIPALPLTVKGGIPKPPLCASPYTSAPPCRPASPCRPSTSASGTVRHSSSAATASAAPTPAPPPPARTTPADRAEGTPDRPADLEPISHGSNTRLPLPQQSNAEREPPPPEGPGIRLPGGTLPPVRTKITPSSLAEQHVLHM